MDIKAIQELINDEYMLEARWWQFSWRRFRWVEKTEKIRGKGVWFRWYPSARSVNDDICVQCYAAVKAFGWSREGMR